MTIVLFKGTMGAQKEQQLFCSKEQQARKRNDNCSIQRNNNHAKGNNKCSKGTTDAQRERQLFRSKEQQVHKKEQQLLIF
jgi:hypothetical protein